jgi:hypothetical protein
MIYLVTTSIKRYEEFKSKFPEQTMYPFIISGPIPDSHGGRGEQFLVDEKVFSLKENKNISKNWEDYFKRMISDLNMIPNIINIIF